MRCYNGAPDSELQALLDQKDADDKALRVAHPDARCTYFPVESKYQIFVGNRMLTRMSPDRHGLIQEAIKILEKEKESK